MSKHKPRHYCAVCDRLRYCQKSWEGIRWDWICSECLDELEEDGEGYAIQLQ